MATPKQIEANRRNSQKSTGPKTALGKARSRLNAIRDNITGQITTLTNEERPIFESIRAGHIEALNPQTPEETKLAQAIAWDAWRLDRIRATEMNIHAHGIATFLENDEEEPDAGSEEDPLLTAFAEAHTFLTHSRRLELLSLYETRLTRNLHRNRELLRALQTDRQIRQTRQREEEILLARFHEIKETKYEAPSALVKEQLNGRNRQ